MKNKALSFLLLWSLLLLACKRNQAQEIPAARNNQSLLWHVSGNGLERPVYLYGTMHILCREDAVLSPQLQTVIGRVDQVYFEINLDDLGQLFGALSSSMMKGDTTLQDLLTKEEYAKVQSYFEKNGQGAQFTMFRKMQPLFTASLIEVNSLPCATGSGTEELILKQARAGKKKIGGLETAEYQLSLFNDIPYRLQAKQLVQAVDSAGSGRAEMQEMIRLYKSQDLEKLYGFTQQGSLADSTLQEKLLTNRNRNWLQQFHEITRGKSVLVAVGAGHLGGRNGLLNLLKAKGYRLVPLQNNFGRL
jgi:uncharacterized protein YbaP (TraB family)